MHAACIRVLLSLALGAALLLAGSGYARRRRAVIKLISSACGLADKRRASPHPGPVRLAQAAKVCDRVHVETGKINCGCERVQGGRGSADAAGEQRRAYGRDVE